MADNFLWSLQADRETKGLLTKALGAPIRAMREGIGNFFGPFIASLKSFLSADMLGQAIKMQAEIQRTTLQMGRSRRDVQNIQESINDIGMSAKIGSEAAKEFVDAMIKGRVPVKDFRELGTTMSKFQEVTGASSQAVSKLSVNLMKMRGTSTNSVKSVLTGMAQVQKSMGLTAEGMDEVVQSSGEILSSLAALGAQTGSLNAMGKAVTKLAATFEQAGLEASQATQLINKLFTSENYEDNLAMMNKLGISASQYADIISGQAPMQQNFNQKMIELGAETERMMKYSPIAAKTFASIWGGGMSAEQLIKLARSNKQKKEESKSLEAMWGETTDTMAKATDQMHNVFDNFLKGISVKLLPAIQPVVMALINLFKNLPWAKIGNAIATGVRKFAEFMQSFNWGGDLRGAFMSFLGEVGKKLGEMLRGIIPFIVDTFKKLFPILIEALKQIGSFIFDALKSFLGNFFKALGPTGSAILGMVIALKVLFSVILPLINGLSMLAPVFPALIGLLTNPVGWIVLGATALIQILIFAWKRWFSSTGINNRMKEITANIKERKKELKETYSKIVDIKGQLADPKTPSDQKKILERQLKQLEIHTELLKVKAQTDAMKSAMYAQRQVAWNSQYFETGSKDYGLGKLQSYSARVKDDKGVETTKNLMDEKGNFNQDVFNELMKSNKEFKEYAMGAEGRKMMIAATSESLEEIKKVIEEADGALGGIWVKEKEGMSARTMVSQQLLQIYKKGEGKILLDAAKKAQDQWSGGQADYKKFTDALKTGTLDQKMLKGINTNFIKAFLGQVKGASDYQKSFEELLSAQIENFELQNLKEEKVNRESNGDSSSPQETMKKATAAIWGVEKGAFVEQQKAQTADDEKIKNMNIIIANMNNIIKGLGLDKVIKTVEDQRNSIN